MLVRRSIFAVGAAGALLVASTLLSTPDVASASSLWATSVPVTNVVASTPTVGGGYPDPGGAPTAGTCRAGTLDANHSESALAVKPGGEDLVGASKFFFDRFSTFYNFSLGAYSMPNGVPTATSQVQGYDCTTVGTQAMPPSWTNVTDPNVAFDTTGRAYQVTLPFNAYWTNLHPNGAIDLSYSDDLGHHWIKGNQGSDLENSPNESSFSLAFEDKQWVAVNSIPGSPNQDHVYAAWALFKGSATSVRFAVSRDRGAHFDPAITITPPSVVGPSNTYVYPSIDAAGTIYVSFVSFPPSGKASKIYVARSTNDGRTFGAFSAVTTVGLLTSGNGDLPNTTFRDGIVESFVASPTYAGHLYLTYEDWDGTQFDVKFTQSTDGGAHWSTPAVVNDATNNASTDQFQPSVAAGPDGAVAVAFYDRRAACPADRSVLRQDIGRRNFCVDVTVQAYRDAGAGAVSIKGNARLSAATWDPQNPAQHVGGLGQMACASHDDPCTESFIGDYFGLVVSATKVYALSVSTHYPSDVTADEGGPVYYQQQVLSTVSRASLGI